MSESSPSTPIASGKRLAVPDSEEANFSKLFCNRPSPKVWDGQLSVRSSSQRHCSARGGGGGGLQPYHRFIAYVVRRPASTTA